MMRMPLALRLLARDLRAGELNLLGIALILAVAAFTSVSFFADRLGQALTREAAQLLGGDLVITADHPPDAGFRARAESLGLRALDSAAFVSMAAANGRSALAGVKAVEPGYPLRGAMRIAPGLNRPDARATAIPAPGTLWLDERLSTALGVRVGETVTLGNARFALAAVLTFEPDRGTNFFSLLPRLVMRVGDLAATGLIQPGSRVSYHLHVAGEAAAVAAFRDWARARLGRGERIEDIDNARPEVRAALDRAQRFLKLAALLAVVLASVAIGLSANRYLRRHLDGYAVMRCLGARQGRLVGLMSLEFLVFGVIAAGLGCAAGWLVQFAIESVLSGLMNGPLPRPGWTPLAHGLAVGLVLLAGFVAPQLARLANVPTLRVLRRELPTRPLSLAMWAAALAALGVLMAWIAADVVLGATVFFGFLSAVLLYGLFAALLFRLLARVRAAGGAGWRHGLASLRRRLGYSLVQTVAIAIGLTALLLLTAARGELLSAWRSTVPADAPNRFVINIQPEQREAVGRFLAKEGLGQPGVLPMVRGRLTAINGSALNLEALGDDRARRLAEREFNLSYLADLPAGNAVIAGRWFGRAGAGQAQFSVEQGLARTLGIRLGDVLAFEVGGARIEAAVTSLRRLEWDSMRVNFFVIAPPGMLEDFPQTFITSFFVPAGRGESIDRLVAAFPNLTVIDVGAILDQVERVLEQLSRAVQLVFAFGLAAGFVVMFAALESTHDERSVEVAILRTLGARNGQLRAALATEFMALGAVAGILGGIGAAAIAWLLATEVFRLAYQPGALIPLAGLALGAIGVTLAGLAATARLLRTPALATLRTLA
ncbi:MAG: ABC transporter permease [Betaproteobacteria bacterium CG2_30_68_42]|nr:MAG: ABC transporter permease [Betaproteobacteria bacterium CG2_30_68_42]PJA58769.1 MAG: ABC transporter permease [Rhodocyclales bacterium CG_4_9_14_3_um_filter_68_10]